MAGREPSPQPQQQQGAQLVPLEDATLSTREVTIVERPCKNACHASGSTSSTSSGPHVCADILDNLLHEIIILINSFHDFLSFIGTCRSWRASVSSFPSVYTFSFPPLHFKPDGPYVRPHTRCMKPLLLSNCKWQLSDPTKKNISLRCSVPQNTPNKMHYLGCSYGYLIFTYKEHCVLVDAYTGAKVKAPKLPRNNKLGLSSGIGVLTAPFSSTNSRLLLFSRAFMFEWQVGTNSWSVHPLHIDDERIHQIVSFKGDILVIDTLTRIHRVQLTPQFSMQKIKIMWELLRNMPINPWLVACGNMLLMVDLSFRSLCSGESNHTGKDDYSRMFEVFRLDFSVEPAKWMKMKKLENQAVFVSLDKRNPAICCMNPERWGGKSNCIYVARLFDVQDETWTAVELGQSVPNRNTIHSMYGFASPPDYSQIGSLWLFPSLVYGASQ